MDLNGGKIINAYVGRIDSDDHVSTLKIIPKDDKLTLHWDYIDAKEKNHIVIYTSGDFKKAYLKGQFRSGIIIENRSADQDPGKIAIPVLTIGSIIIGALSSLASFLLNDRYGSHIVGVNLVSLGATGYKSVISIIAAFSVTLALVVLITLLILGARYIPKAVNVFRAARGPQVQG